MAKTSELLDAHALRSRLERVQRTLETTRRLSAILQPEELLKALVRAAAELTDSEQGAVARTDSTGLLRLAWAPWLPAREMDVIEISEDSPLSQAYRSLWPAIGAEQPDLGARNLLAVPMVVEGAPWACCVRSTSAAASLTAKMCW